MLVSFFWPFSAMMLLTSLRLMTPLHSLSNKRYAYLGGVCSAGWEGRGGGEGREHGECYPTFARKATGEDENPREMHTVRHA